MRVLTDGRLPVKCYASQVEDGALEQARNLANLPCNVHHIALMPDAHQGFGMPIGGVIFTDGAVIPNAVGVDIGCGVALLSTGMRQEDLSKPEIKLILDGIAKRVPTGFSKHANQDSPNGDKLLKAMKIDWGERFAKDMLDDEIVEWQWFDETLDAMGTLGGGNHFIELQADELGYVYVMLHSGSRGLGKRIGDFYHKQAVELCERYRTPLPTKDLAFFPAGTEENSNYVDAMNFGLAWAEQNRVHMLAQVIEVLRDFPCSPKVEVNVHHNYAAWENHFGVNGIVHRKGAIRARKDEILLIPGSMGASSYIAKGLGNPDSYNTCQHGAGRAMGRNDAKRRYEAGELENLATFMGSRNIQMGGRASEAIDEHPGAYKDIEQVMADSVDLIVPVHKMTPLGVVKG